MIPASVRAAAEARGPFPFGFRQRFFLALSLGFLWLFPAWSRPRLAYGMLVWDVAVCAVWFYDWWRLPAAGSLGAERTWSSTLTLTEQTSVTLHVTNAGHTALPFEVMEQLPPSLWEEPVLLRSTVAAHGSSELRYTIKPGERGNQEAGCLFLRYWTALGFAERWASIPLAQTVSVYPAALGSKEQVLYLIRSRQFDLKKRQRRQPGMGREFESLREYREGDEMRDISWTATARRNQAATQRRQLISRVYTAERSQTVWVLVDAGRLLGARVAGDTHATTASWAKLDYSANAALSLVEVALLHGDQAGLLVYGRSIQQAVAPGRGSRQLRQVSEALAQAKVEPNEANHGKAARMLMQKQSRRALVVWITDFAETAATPEVIEYAAYLGKRHLLLLGAMGQPDLELVAESVPRDEREMFRHAAALEIAARRNLLLHSLRQTGVLALELAPGTSVAALMNEYLKIKDRNLL